MIREPGTEKEADKLGESAWKRAGMTREKTLGRLEQYMRQAIRPICTLLYNKPDHVMSCHVMYEIAKC